MMTLTLARINGNGMHRFGQIPQRRMNGAVTVEAAKPCQFGRTDQNGKMAFPRAIIARMARMAAGIVDHLQSVWRKAVAQALGNLLFYLHGGNKPLQSWPERV
jgi:hypothetical protein